MQNICSELRSHTGDCSTAVALSAGIVLRNSVISAAHFAVQSSAPAPGSPPETPQTSVAQPSVERERSRHLDTGAVPLAVRAGQQSTGSSNLGERRPRTRQKQQGCHHRAHGEARAACSGRQSCKLLRAPPRDINLVCFHRTLESADGRRAAVRTGTSRL